MEVLVLVVWCFSIVFAEKNSCNIQCNPGAKLDEEYCNCEVCPGLNKPCDGCCYPPEQMSCDQTSGRCVCIANCNDSFVMAAQVALGAALAIAFLALVALFWKTCPRRNASNNGHSSSLIRERESSLTSMQRFIMQRLRDRPPRYEDNNQIRLEKPPPYQETAGTESQLPGTWGTEPPEYSEVIGETTSNNNKSDPPRNEECRSGAENPGFSLQDEAPQSRHTETELHM
ncbi:uncharacterized protein [Periplaneta americana]|uniref:uncharacterized protein n=1 Tax=Periplaneta americana TaxID=6978 RepID=UPI0037E86E53